MPGDAANVKKQYQKWLDLEIANTQRHMNASLLYRVQGQPNVQPKSYQTLTEKLADATKLKVTLRQELLQLTDDVNAGQIVEQANVGELGYIAQNMPRLIKLFAKTHALGVPWDIFLAKVREDMGDQQKDEMRELGIGGEGGDDGGGGGGGWRGGGDDDEDRKSVV